jgi:16S rRNA (cytosine967-C5)-methyltransferase
MHPNALIDACAQLVREVLAFEHPADAVVSRFFREHRGLGQRERAALAETAYTVLRKKLLFDHMAPSGSGPRERRLAILGFAHWQDEEARRAHPEDRHGARVHAARDFLLGALNEREREWLAQCDAVDPAELLERHRHNLPEWLVAPLKAQLGEAFWPEVVALSQSAPLDLRVNVFKEKRAAAQAELAKAAIKTEVTPYSPWGLRAVGKPQLSKLPAFVRGAIEVQDEGSQLLALLVDAKRGEMVVDFCAGAGGKTLALGASMRSTGRL